MEFVFMHAKKLPENVIRVCRVSFSKGYFPTGYWRYSSYSLICSVLMGP